MNKADKTDKKEEGKIAVSEAEWRKKLTPEQFNVTRKHGTERAFSHPYHQEKRSRDVPMCLLWGPAFQL